MTWRRASDTTAPVMTARPCVFCVRKRVLVDLSRPSSYWTACTKEASRRVEALKEANLLRRQTFPESVTFTTLLTGRSLPVEIESVVTDSQIRVLPYPRSLLLERTVPNQVPLRELGQGRTLCLTEAARELKDQGARGELPDSRCVHGSHS